MATRKVVNKNVSTGSQKSFSMRTTNKSKLTKCRPIVLYSTPIRILGPAAFTCALNPLQNAMPPVTLTPCPFSLFSAPVQNP